MCLGGCCSACTGSHSRAEGTVYCIMLARVYATGLGSQETTIFTPVFATVIPESRETMTTEPDVAHFLRMS